MVTEALKAKRLEEERLAKQKEAEEADMKARVAELEQARCIELEKLRAELESSVRVTASGVALLIFSCLIALLCRQQLLSG